MRLSHIFWMDIDQGLLSTTNHPKKIHPQVSKKKSITFHYTGCFVGIIRFIYHNPYITGDFIPYIKQPGLFDCSGGSDEPI